MVKGRAISGKNFVVNKIFKKKKNAVKYIIKKKGNEVKQVPIKTNVPKLKAFKKIIKPLSL